MKSHKVLFKALVLVTLLLLSACSVMENLGTSIIGSNQIPEGTPLFDSYEAAVSYADGTGTFAQDFVGSEDSPVVRDTAREDIKEVLLVGRVSQAQPEPPVRWAIVSFETAAGAGQETASSGQGSGETGRPLVDSLGNPVPGAPLYATINDAISGVSPVSEFLESDVIVNISTTTSSEVRGIEIGGPGRLESEVYFFRMEPLAGTFVEEPSAFQEFTENAGQTLGGLWDSTTNGLYGFNETWPWGVIVSLLGSIFIWRRVRRAILIQDVTEVTQVVRNEVPMGDNLELQGFGVSFFWTRSTDADQRAQFDLLEEDEVIKRLDEVIADWMLGLASQVQIETARSLRGLVSQRLYRNMLFEDIEDLGLGIVPRKVVTSVLDIKPEHAEFLESKVRTQTLSDRLEALREAHPTMGYGRIIAALAVTEGNEILRGLTQLVLSASNALEYQDFGGEDVA